MDATLAAYQQSVVDRMEEGLRAIQQTGVTLMHEIASEVWRAAGGDRGDTQARILDRLSRDQAIRGLIAHNDERFQVISTRTASLESTLASMAESSRALKDAVARGVEELRAAANSPEIRGIEDIRARLSQVEHHLAATFERLHERDQILIGSIQEQIRDHGSLIHQETGRIVEALEGYVKEGVAAMGNLAGRVQEQSEAGGSRAEAITERLAETVAEQIQLMYERLGIETRALSEAFATHESWILRTLEASSSRFDESLEGHVSNVREAGREASREIGGELARALESRVHGLAELVRSDSEAIRGALRDATAAQSEELAQALDDRLGRVSEAITAATRWTIEEMTRRIGDVAAQALQRKLDEAVTVIDRNMVRVADTLDTELDRLGQRVAQAADAAVEQRFERTIERLDGATAAMDRVSARIEQATEEAVSRGLEERMSSLARMIRSDNRVMAERIQVAADQEPAKQVLRAVKEMQASLPNELSEVIDRRLAAMTETVNKTGEILGQKVDRIAARMGEGERYDRDMNSVIERMGDAMHALASLGRPDRIELD